MTTITPTDTAVSVTAHVHEDTPVEVERYDVDAVAVTIGTGPARVTLLGSLDATVAVAEQLVAGLHTEQVPA